MYCMLFLKSAYCNVALKLTLTSCMFCYHACNTCIVFMRANVSTSCALHVYALLTCQNMFVRLFACITAWCITIGCKRVANRYEHHIVLLYTAESTFVVYTEALICNKCTDVTLTVSPLCFCLFFLSLTQTIGTNMHALDPYRMPSPAAWARGQIAATKILEQHKANTGFTYKYAILYYTICSKQLVYTS
jgi:CobN/Magnesium Chelatase